MSSPITKEQCERITDLIRNWPVDENLRWDEVCRESEHILDYVPTRQALSKKLLVKNAFQLRKEEIKRRNETLSSISRPKSMPAAIEQIARLRDKNEQLKAEINLMAEVAQRFIYNASLHGLTHEQLMKPLPNKQNG